MSGSEDRGVLYIASREPYLSEAAQSARSVQEHHPDLPITLYAPDTEDAADVFDDVRVMGDANHDFSDSNLTSEHLPYDRTLFLDTDTYVTGSLKHVFDVLDRNDVAAAQDPTRTGTVDHDTKIDVPDTYPQYNTGVLALRDNKQVRELLNRWNHLYHTVEAKHDLNQPSFRIALYESDVDLATLPPEYNFRIGNVANSVLYACGPVRIVHGRSMHWELPDTAAKINESTGRRAIVAKPHPQIIEDSDRTAGETAQYAADRAQWAYRKKGPVAMVLTVGSMLKDKLVKA